MYFNRLHGYAIGINYLMGRFNLCLCPFGTNSRPMSHYWNEYKLILIDISLKFVPLVVIISQL